MKALYSLLVLIDFQTFTQVELPLAEPDSERLSSVPPQPAFSPCLLSAVAYVEPVPTVIKIISMYSCTCT